MRNSGMCCLLQCLIILYILYFRVRVVYVFFRVIVHIKTSMSDTLLSSSVSPVVNVLLLLTAQGQNSYCAQKAGELRFVN